MTRTTCRRLALVLFFACLSVGFIAAQEDPQKSAAGPASDQKTQQEPAQQPVNPDAAIGRDLANASSEAEEAEEGGVHEENGEFKYSAMVARLGSYIGIGPHGMYWVSLCANFVFLGLFFWMLLKSKLPQMFRDRTASIQKALTEAQTLSAEASRRLADIEARMAKFDAEVSEIRAGAEREAAAEEQRMHAAEEDDKRKVVESAEAEIAAIARSARHDLKRFAASLAVDIAAHRIKVDDKTDQALVRQFVSHFGEDGE
jgi:F-type H+-transporting ATPase subunit b